MTTTHQPAAPAPDLDVAQHIASSPKPGSGLAAVQATRGVGSEAVVAVAEIIATYPSERDSILGWLHQNRGNAFVQQVMRATATLGQSGTSAKLELPTDPVERARHDWRHAVPALRGNADEILVSLAVNASCNLYLGTIAMLVRTEDPVGLAALQKRPQPLWTQAIAEAKQVATADTAVSAAYPVGGNSMIGDRRAAGALNASQDPAYQAEIIRQLQDHGRLDAVVELSYGPMNSGASRYTLGSALANASADGVLPVATLAKKTGAAWYDRQLIAGSDQMPGALQLEQQAAQAPIEAAKRELQTAQDAITQLDMRCAGELNDLTPALTLAELKQYISTFRGQAEYAAAAAQVTRAANDLRAAMQRFAGVEEALLDAGRGGGSASLIVDQYVALAGSSVEGARQAERWASQKCVLSKGKIVRIVDPHFADQRSKLEQLYTNFDTTTSPDIVKRVKDVLANAKEAPLKVRFQEAWSAFDANYLEPYQQLKYTAGAREVPGLWSKFIHLDSLIDGQGKPKVKEIKHEMAELKAAAEELDPLTKRLTSAVADMFLVFGEVSNGGVGNLGSVAGNASDSVVKLQELLGILRNESTNDAAQDIKTLRRLNGEVAIEGRRLAGSIPFLDSATGLYAMVSDLQSLNSTEGRDPFVYAQFLGDFFATVGGIAELAPPPWDAAGVMLSVAGQAVSGAAALLDHLFNGGGESAIAKEKQSLLTTMDTDPKTKKNPNAARDSVISQDAAAENMQVAQSRGMSTDRIDQMTVSTPGLFKLDHAMRALSVIQDHFERGCFPTLEYVVHHQRWMLRQRSFDQFVTTTLDTLGADQLLHRMSALRWTDVGPDTIIAPVFDSLYPTFFGHAEGDKAVGGVFGSSEWTLHVVR